MRRFLSIFLLVANISSVLFAADLNKDPYSGFGPMLKGRFRVEALLLKYGYGPVIKYCLDNEAVFNKGTWDDSFDEGDSIFGQIFVSMTSEDSKNVSNYKTLLADIEKNKFAPAAIKDLDHNDQLRKKLPQRYSSYPYKGPAIESHKLRELFSSYIYFNTDPASNEKDAVRTEIRNAMMEKFPEHQSWNNFIITQIENDAFGLDINKIIKDVY